MLNLEVQEWRHDIPYNAFDVVCIKWTCLSGAITKYDYFASIAGSPENLNLNRNPITFPLYWARIETNT